MMTLTFVLAISVTVAFLVGCPVGILRARRKLPMDGRFYFRASVIPLLILMIIGIATMLITRYRDGQLDDPFEDARRGVAGGFIAWVVSVGPYLGGIIAGNVIARRNKE